MLSMGRGWTPMHLRRRCESRQRRRQVLEVFQDEPSVAVGLPTQVEAAVLCSRADGAVMCGIFDKDGSDVRMSLCLSCRRAERVRAQDSVCFEREES